MPDQLDYLINDAFDDFASAERATASPVPGAAAARHTVAVQRRTRYAALTLLGAVLLAVPVAAYATNPRGNNSPPAANPTATASPSPSQSQSPAPAVTPVDVRNTTLVLPPFPGLAQDCMGGGTRKFVDGKANLGGSGNVEWIIAASAPILANLDGLPGNEELTTITCQTDGSVHATQLLALKIAADGSLTPMGYVVNSPDVPNLTAFFSSATVQDGVVQLTADGPYQSDGWPPCDRQVRGYAYRNGAFTQVSGATKFTRPSHDLTKVDFAGTGLLLGLSDAAGGGSVYCVPMVGGTGQTNIYPGGDTTKGTVAYTVTGGEVSFLSTSQGKAAFGVFTFQAADGSSFQTVQYFQPDAADYPLGQEILRSGTNGVTGIDKVATSGATVQVTVRTASGTHIWTYQQNPTNQNWERSNP